MKRFTDMGRLEERWVNEYCRAEGGYKRCVRYMLEEEGIWHPDYLLPNGEIREELKK